MEDPNSFFTIEDDGSLVILKSTSANSDTFDSVSDSLLAASMESTGSRTITDNDNAVSVPDPATGTLPSCSKIDEAGSQAATDENEDDDLGILSLAEINQILKKEQENLQLIRMANEMMKSLVVKQSSLSAQMKDASVNTTNLETPPPAQLDDSIMRKEDLEENEDLLTPGGGPVRPYQRLFRRLSNNFRRRRQPVSRPNRMNNNNSPSNINVQAFVQDYYRSLGSVSRYIILASILSFITAFLLLSWYSAQTHSHDMELFHLKEQRVLANQEVYDKLQLNHENFRESLIHMRYEETRECHSSLKECQAKRDVLLTQISHIEQSSGKGQSKLEAKLDTQRKFIETLQSKLRELNEENKGLRKEIGQSFSSSYAQILLSFLNIARNRSIQIAFGTVFTIGMLFVIAGTALSK